MLDIYTYPTLNQLKDYLDRIHHCVKVVDKWISDSKFPFALTPTKYNWTNVALMITKQKEWMVTKDYWNKLGFSQRK